MDPCIYCGIKVQVERFDGEHISQICQWTGCQRGCGGDRQNDWMWVKQVPETRYGVWNGRLPW